MSIVLAIVATAVIAGIAHLTYGAILAGREYDRSEQAWVNAEDRLIPRHTMRPANRAVAGRLQRA
jgi:hypothetical protein